MVSVFNIVYAVPYIILCRTRRMKIVAKQTRRIRRICQVFMLPLTFFCITGLLYQSTSSIQLWDGQTKKILTQFRLNQPSVQKFDVLLNSYMRAGSSYTGRLLGYREDSFYWYEPLWSFNSVVYYRGKEEICSSNTHKCITLVHLKTNLSQKAIQNYPYELRNMIDHRRNYTWRYHSLDEIQEFLENIYRCNFTDVAKGVWDGMTDRLSGPIWKPYRECRQRNTTKAVCLQIMEKLCNRTSHRVTKVLRMSSDNLDKILVRNPKIKVIQQFRDPRAVINSRLTTDWYYLKENKSDVNYDAIRANADGLCRRMTYDLKMGMYLQDKFPSRFAFLLFEDIYSDMQKSNSDLYRYIGMEVPKKDDKFLNNSDIGKYEHTVVKKSSDFSSWWRTQLSFGASRAIEDACAEVFSVFPYLKLSSESELRDLNFSSWKMHPLFETQRLVN